MNFTDVCCTVERFRHSNQVSSALSIWSPFPMFRTCTRLLARSAAQQHAWQIKTLNVQSSATGQTARRTKNGPRVGNTDHGKEHDHNDGGAAEITVALTSQVKKTNSNATWSNSAQRIGAISVRASRRAACPRATPYPVQSRRSAACTLYLCMVSLQAVHHDWYAHTYHWSKRTACKKKKNSAPARFYAGGPGNLDFFWCGLSYQPAQKYITPKLRTCAWVHRNPARFWQIMH